MKAPWKIELKNLLKVGLESNMDWVAVGFIQCILGNLPMIEVACFPWAACSGAYLFSVKRICVQAQISLVRLWDKCYLSYQLADLKHISLWLSLFHAEKSYFYLALPWREAVVYLLIILKLSKLKHWRYFSDLFFGSPSLI